MQWARFGINFFLCNPLVRVNMKNCLLLVVLDGAGDLPNPKLGGRTPLEAAGMRSLNSMLARCSAGRIYTIGKGIAPESDAAVMSLLGYDVEREYTGRGPLETFGAGLEVRDDDLGVRCNFATISDSMDIIDRRAGRNVTDEEAKGLEKVINAIRIGGVELKFKATVGHRGVLRIRSEDRKLSANISNADIGYVKSGNISVASNATGKRMPKVEALDGTPEAAYTAGVLNRFITEVTTTLNASNINANRKSSGKLPANVLLMRDAGLGLPKVKKFGDKFGLKAAFVADMPVERGIARLAGMDELRVETSMPSKDKYARMAEIVRDNYRKFDFVYLHIKGPDEPGHDGEAELKTRVLEEIDHVFFNGIAQVVDNLTLCVTADHATPCTLKRHSDDPVPVVVKSADPSKNTDTATFSEVGVKNGAIGTIIGRELINLLEKYR